MVFVLDFVNDSAKRSNQYRQFVLLHSTYNADPGIDNIQSYALTL